MTQISLGNNMLSIMVAFIYMRKKENSLQNTSCETESLKHTNIISQEVGQGYILGMVIVTERIEHVVIEYTQIL